MTIMSILFCEKYIFFSKYLIDYNVDVVQHILQDIGKHSIMHATNNRNEECSWTQKQ